MAADSRTAPGRAARDAMADELARADPQAPTLCEGWDVAHLAAHLVLRDSRPDVTLAGVLGIGGLSGYAEHQLDTTATSIRYPHLVDLVRRGPRLSPTRVRAVDDAVNSVEMAVHREDVRRGAVGWRPDRTAETLDPAVTGALARSVSRLGWLAARSVPGPLEARLTDVPARPGDDGAADGAANRAADGGGRPVHLRGGAGEPVVVTGPVLEVVLFLFGRDAAAAVELSGPSNRVAAVRSARRGA